MRMWLDETLPVSCLQHIGRVRVDEHNGAFLQLQTVNKPIALSTINFIRSKFSNTFTELNKENKQLKLKGTNNFIAPKLSQFISFCAPKWLSS